MRLLTHCDRRAASRAAWIAGRRSAISTAMIAITTKSSISVKPGRRRDGKIMTFLILYGTEGREAPVAGTSSIFLGIHHLAVSAVAEAAENERVDRVLDEPDRPVTKREVG